MKNIGYIRVPKTGSGSIENFFKQQKNKHLICGIHHLPYVLLSEHTHQHEYFSFVREPLQLYSSFYFFMKKRISYEHIYNNPLDYTPMNKKNIDLLESKATVEEFLLECPKNQMLSYFIDPLPISELSFVGITENMDESINFLNDKFNFSIENKSINVNTDKTFLSPYSFSKNIEKKFRLRNEREYEIYEKAKEIFIKNLKEKIMIF